MEGFEEHITFEMSFEKETEIIGGNRMYKRMVAWKSRVLSVSREVNTRISLQ
jgi:hypothetical protein